MVNSEGVSEEVRLEYLCTLMRYETTFLIDAREELKDAYRLSEIDKEEYEKKFAEQRDLFFRIYRFPGVEVYKTIEDDVLKNFGHELKVKVLNGLSYYIEVCIRRRKFSEVDDVLTYVFNELIYNYHDLFKKKLGRINNAKKDNKMKYEDYIRKGSVGDRRTQLEVTKNAGKASTRKINLRKKAKMGSLGVILDEALNNPVQ